MKTNDMKADIVRLVHWKQQAADNDKAGALRWRLPRVGATVKEIEAAERVFGAELPSEYKDFLSLTNGWEGFYVLADLFGTNEIVQGRSGAVLERQDVKRFLEENHWSNDVVIPIGDSPTDLDVFLLLAEQVHALPGGVVWLAGQEVDRFDSFQAFLSAMVNYNAQIANKLAANRRVNQT